jgi:hypothetical protein
MFKHLRLIHLVLILRVPLLLLTMLGCWALPAGPPDPEETASASASATKSSTSSRAQPAAVAVAPAPDMALRNAFNPRNASAALVGPSQPVSPAALRWCSQLGIAAATLHHWQAGMTVLPHPNTQQQVSHQAGWDQGSPADRCSC